MSKIKILLIEDNRLLREGITTMINEQADMTVVTTSAGNDNILLKARTTKAQVILVRLQHQDGLRIVKSASKELPEMKVIGMGLIPTQSDVVEFVQAGASGFVLEDATVEDFLTTIRWVADGGKVIPPPLTQSLFSHVVEHAFKRGNGQSNNPVQMTKREREIIALIAEGLRNKEIARRLTIATYTVKSHVHTILEKTALHNRLQIAAQSHNGVFN